MYNAENKKYLFTRLPKTLLSVGISERLYKCTSRINNIIFIICLNVLKKFFILYVYKKGFQNIKKSTLSEEYYKSHQKYFLK